MRTSEVFFPMRSHHLSFGLLFGLALLAAIATTGVAVAQYTPSYIFWTLTEPATNGEPDASGTAFALSVSQSPGGAGPTAIVQSFHGTAACSDGSNFTAGSIACRFLSPQTGAYSPCQSGGWTLTTGISNQSGPELKVTNPFGKVFFKTVGVNCNGGSWDAGVTVGAEGSL